MSRFQRILNAWQPTKPRSKKVEIVEYSKGVIRPAVDDFVKAAESAQSKFMQSRIRLYDHYTQTMMFDNVVASLIEKRLENIGNKKIVLYDGEEPIENVEAFFTAPRFRQFLKDIVISRVLWGFGVFEFDETDYKGQKWFDYRLIPIKHVNPYTKEILKYQNDHTGWNVSELPDYLFVGDPDDLGLLLKITLLSLYRRLGMFNYGKYVDLASENFMQLMTREFADNDNIQALQEKLSRRDGGGMMTLPDGVDLKSENQSSSSQNQLFEGYMQMLKDELAVLILGQTMTTEDGASRSQAEVHQIEQSAKYSADEQLVVDVLNYEMIERLPLWDIKVNDNMRFALEPTSDEEMNMQLRNMLALKNLGIVYTEEELRDKFKTIL